MAWVRIHDGAMTHPKIVGLIDWRNPFCVWVWGLSYSQLHLTDGIIPTAAVPHPKAVKTIQRLLDAGCWEVIPGLGWKVHDYLEWNDSREVVQSKREGAKNRFQSFKQKRVVTPTIETTLARSGVVLGSSSEEEKDEPSIAPRMQRPGMPIDDRSPETTDRGALFLERYGELFQQHRRGAKYFCRPQFDLPEAQKLTALWDDGRLEKMATIFLTADRDEWINRTDRGFKIFAMKASLMDQWLTEWEAKARESA